MSLAPFIKPIAPKKRNGEDYRCTVARHLPSLKLQGMWAQVERLTNVAEYEKRNRLLPHDQWTYPVLHAAISTLADATNVSYNTARSCIKQFVKLGLLTPRFAMGKKPLQRPETGRWQVNEYDVTLHDDYAQFQECPPFRFCRRDGQLVVKSELRKIDSGGAGRFPKSEPHPETYRIVELRNAGKTYQEIGDIVALNKGYVHRIFKQSIKDARVCPGLSESVSAIN